MTILLGPHIYKSLIMGVYHAQGICPPTLTSIPIDLSYGVDNHDSLVNHNDAPIDHYWANANLNQFLL